MASTTDFIAQPGAWTAVNDVDVSYALVQVKHEDPIRVVVAQSAPAASSTDGIVVDMDRLDTLPLHGLGAGDVVYVKAISEETPVCAFTA